MNNEILHYDALQALNEEFYKNVLTHENLENDGAEVRLAKLHYPDHSTDEEANFWGYVLKKNNVKYLLSSVNVVTKEQVHLRDWLPLKPNKAQKVANNKDVFMLINKPIKVNLSSKEEFTVREMVDFFSGMKHTNPKGYKVFWMLMLSTTLFRTNLRISSSPGFGKDSAVDTMNYLLGGHKTITSPTVPKLELLANTSKVLAISEVINIPKEQWHNIEQFLLDVAAFKNQISKRSRGTNGVGEIIDISDLSLLLFYNDIDCYTDMYDYFDYHTKAAVKDRFPAFRFGGRLTQDFTAIKSKDLSVLVKLNLDNYKKLLYSLTYYKDNALNKLKGFKHPEIPKGFSTRWVTCLDAVFKVIDLYSESQSEFDAWCIQLFKTMKDYKDMVTYPMVLEKNPKASASTLRDFDTFSEKIEMAKSGKVVLNNKTLEDW